MPNIIRHVIRRAKRRIRDGLRDGRSFELLESGCQLLAQYDYDDRRVSVARIAKGAGVSVGAFYSRYQSKEHFVYFVTGNQFRFARDAAIRDLSPEQWRPASTEKVIRAIVGHVVTRMGMPKTAGVTRAVFKLAPKVPHILEPLQEYREAVAQCAHELLDRRLSNDQSPRYIDASIQILFATVIDTSLERAGPLKPRSQAMTDALSDMILRFLRVAGDRAWSPTNDEPAEVASAIICTEMADENGEDDEIAKVPDGHVPIVDPDLRTVIGSTPLAPGRKSRRKPRSPRPLPVTAPSAISATKLRPNATPPAVSIKHPRRRRIRLV